MSLVSHITFQKLCETHRKGGCSATIPPVPYVPVFSWAQRGWGLLHAQCPVCLSGLSQGSLAVIPVLCPPTPTGPAAPVPSASGGKLSLVTPGLLAEVLAPGSVLGLQVPFQVCRAP